MRGLLLLMMLGCGEETIELVPHRDGSVLDDGGMCVLPASPRKCQGLGASCGAEVECCSGRCQGQICLPAGSCLGPGTACTGRSDCCSGRCEPTPGSAGLTCLNFCLTDGLACARAQDCCALGCHGGVCGTDLCKQQGDDCNINSDCCSGLCTNARCQLDTVASCLPTGESCISGGGQPCCSGVCGSSGRCDFGPGPCRPTGALCSVNGDCCRGSCVSTGDNTLTCLAPCIASGGNCTQSADCCDQLSCSGSPATCGGPESACKRLGGGCQQDSECCSGLCAGGFCGTSCPIQGM